MMSILVATDFSAASVEASRVAAYLARAMQLPLKLVHVLEPGVVLAASLPKKTSGEVAPQTATALRLIGEARSALSAIWRDVACEILVGDVRDALATQVRDRPPQLMVVGGERVATIHASENDLAESLAQDLPCAVLVVRPTSSPLTAALTKNRRLRMFVAFDRTEGAREPVVNWLQWMRKRMPCDVIESEPSAVSSLAILHAAMAANADLIVIGSHSRAGPQTHASLAIDVLRHSELPVVCISLEVSRFDGVVPFRLMESQAWQEQPA